MRISATVRSLPTRYALCRFICSRPSRSFPLNTYNLHPSVGFLASGGSLYLSTVLVPSDTLTVLVAAASRPEGLKLGLALFSGGAEPEFEGERWAGDRDRERGRDAGDAERRRVPREDGLSLS